MKLITYRNFICTLMILFVSCVQKEEIDISKEKEAILKLHKAQRDYHITKDSIAFANLFSENYVEIGKGKITTQTKSERITRCHKYFSSVEFIKWDDVSDPIIRFSDDASVAYSFVDKLVVITYPDEKGDTIEDRTHYAWTAIYRKYSDGWKIESVTSTEKP